MATGKLICLTGPAASGKDTYAEGVVERLQGDYSVHLLSGSPIFRSAALYAVGKGYDPSIRLPSDTFDRASLTLYTDGKVEVSDTRGIQIYNPQDLNTEAVGRAGSLFAKHSADVYKGFVIGAVRNCIRTNSKEGTHTIMGARDSWNIADDLKGEVKALRCYVTASDEVRRERLSQKFGNVVDVEEKVRAEFERDSRDVVSGTLPSPPGKFVQLPTSHYDFSTPSVFLLDTSTLDIPHAVDTWENLVRAFLSTNLIESK